ncbi:MAG: hypothetical protein GX663_01885 [Clostridiales bacterium]|nr:hypothetical protein [Clostridiales bacterium]
MLIKEDLLFDFAVNMPRILVSGHTTVLDNVKRVMLLTDTEIIVFNGKRFTSVKGRDFVVERLMDERMLIAGEVEEVRFFAALQKDKAGGE